MEKETQALFTSILGLQHAFFETVRSMLPDNHVHPRQGPILSLLVRHEGLSQADLVREMKVSAATVAVSLARLEKLGFVTRERNQSNQRANVLTLTPKGKEEAIRVQDAMQCVWRIALTGFSEEEIKEAASYFRRMKDNIRNQLGAKERDRSHASDL